MNPLFVALLGALLVPLFVGSWRVSIFGLGCQGLLMAAVAHGLHPRLSAADAWLDLTDLAVVRGLAVPGVLYTASKLRNMPARREVIPPNILSWTIALALVLASFSFAETLAPESSEQSGLIAVATSGVLLGFLVLATQSDPFSQVIGALRIENAVALVLLGTHSGVLDFELKVGLLAVFVATVALFRVHLLRSSADTTPADDAAGGPTL